jgi:hypothetical protein
MDWFWWRPPFLLRTVIVNLKDEPTAAIQGACWSARGPWLVLRRASLLKAGTEATPIDGEIVIHRDNISFLQVP